MTYKIYMRILPFYALVVDDSVIVSRRLVTQLKEINSESFIANAGDYTAAVKLLEEYRFHIALLDINLPGQNGIELLSYIKKNYPEVKTVMISNQTSEYYKHACEELGTDRFIDKSSAFEALPSVLRELVPAD